MRRKAFCKKRQACNPAKQRRRLECGVCFWWRGDGNSRVCRTLGSSGQCFLKGRRQNAVLSDNLRAIKPRHGAPQQNVRPNTFSSSFVTACCTAIRPPRWKEIDRGNLRADRQTKNKKIAFLVPIWGKQRDSASGGEAPEARLGRILSTRKAARFSIERSGSHLRFFWCPGTEFSDSPVRWLASQQYRASE